MVEVTHIDVGFPMTVLLARALLSHRGGIVRGVDAAPMVGSSQ